MIGGEIALRLNPEVLRELAAPMSSVIVSGTNGKSTTTRMLRAALSTCGVVASNTNGDNMTSGIVTALMNEPRASFSALEVDEMHVPLIAQQVRPAAVVLLNLSRDQLDRVGEIGSVERRLREAVNAHPQALIVANCDDPLIVSAAADAKKVLWVAAGAAWSGDSAAYPRGGRVVREGSSWHLIPSYPGEPLPDLRERPVPHWHLEDIEVMPAGEKGPRARLIGPDGLALDLHVQLPGRANLGNAAQALVAAFALGADPQEALRAVSTVSEIAGRYSLHDIEGRLVRIMLAKNPAGWQEAMSMVNSRVAQVVIGVNGQVPDGQDLSWLWDVDFSGLIRGRDCVPRVIACGERGADLAVRLEYANIHCELVDTPMEALKRVEPGRVEMLLNYTALRDFKTVLESREKNR